MLKDVFERYGVLHGDFVLASGQKSRRYFDSRMVVLHPDGAYAAATAVLDCIADLGVDAVGGKGLGAAPVVGAVVAISRLCHRPIHGFLVRDAVKEHGTQKTIEGHLWKGARVALFEDVVTTGGSVMRAIEAVEAEGAVIVKIVVLLDRQEGGLQGLRDLGYDCEALLTAEEVVGADSGC